MTRKVAIVTSLVVICAISILLLGCPPRWSELGHLKPGWNIMERHPIQRPSGLEVIGGIGEGNGSGFRAIGSTNKRVESE